MPVKRDPVVAEREREVYSPFVRKFSFMTICGDLVRSARTGDFTDQEHRRFRTYLEEKGKGGAIMAGLMTARQAPEGSPLHDWGIEAVKSGLDAYYREDTPAGTEAADVADFVVYSTRNYPELRTIFAQHAALWRLRHDLIAEAAFESWSDENEADGPEFNI